MQISIRNSYTRNVHETQFLVLWGIRICRLCWRIRQSISWQSGHGKIKIIISSDAQWMFGELELETDYGSVPQYHRSRVCVPVRSALYHYCIDALLYRIIGTDAGIQGTSSNHQMHRFLKTTLVHLSFLEQEECVHEQNISTCRTTTFDNICYEKRSRPWKWTQKHS